MDSISLKSIKTETDGASPEKKKRTKGLFQQETQFVRAYEFETPKAYLNAILQKQVRQNDKHSFGAEIFRHVRKEYNAKLKQGIKYNIVTGSLDQVFPEDGKAQDINVTNSKLAIEDKKRELEK